MRQKSSENRSAMAEAKREKLSSGSSGDRAACHLA